MADKIGGIYVDLGLNTAAFSTGLTKAQGQIKGFGVVARASLGKVGGSLFAGLTSGALGAAAGILSFSAAIDTSRQALKEFGDIADNARAAGLDSEFFQGLAYQASLGGVGIEQLSSSLTAFARNSGLAEVGAGRMATALGKLNPELLKNIQAATTQEERIRLAADAIANASGASEKAALSVALFGDAGAKLADVFSGGAVAIDAAMVKAKGLGLVVSRELIASADELGDKFDTATKILDLQFKQALVNLAPILISTAGLAGDLAKAIGGLINQMQSMENRTTASLEGRLATIKEILSNAATDITLPSGEIVNSNPMAMSPGGGADVDELKAEQAQLETILATRKAIATATVPPIVPGAGGDGGAAQDAIDKAKAVLESLQFEEEQLARTSIEQEIYNNLKSAGVSAESDFGKQIAAATTSLETQRKAIEDNKDAMKQFSDIAKSATEGFIKDLLSGKSAAEALGNVFSQLADKFLGLGLDAIFGGGKGDTGILGKIFGFADGGIAAHGRPLPTFASGGVSRTASIFGEAGPEAAVPLPDGRRIPVDLRMPSKNAQGGGIAVSVSVGVENGELVPLIAQVSGEVSGRQIEQRTPIIVKQVAPGAVAIANRNRTG